MTNKCTVISQIITLLHVSKLSFHPKGVCDQYIAKLHKYLKYTAMGNCEIIVLLLVIVRNNKGRTVHVLKK
jgi:hypothetical protein